MERLYQLSRSELVKVAAYKSNLQPECFDPFTDQMLRDYIVSRSVTEFLESIFN